MKFIAALMLVLVVGTAAALRLGGPSGLALLEDLQNSSNTSDLWTWGTTPAGHILLNNSSVEGAWIPSADRSVMETPSEVVPQDGSVGSSSGGQSVAGFVPIEGFGKSTKGVFDATCFKAPTQAKWPRVYP